MIRMVGIDAPAELRRIVRARRPALVVVGDLTPSRLDPATVALLRALLAREYRVVEHVSNTTVYERRGAHCGAPDVRVSS